MFSSTSSHLASGIFFVPRYMEKIEFVEMGVDALLYSKLEATHVAWSAKHWR